MTNLRDCQTGHGTVFVNVLAHIPYRALGVGVATVALLHVRGVVPITRRLALCLAALVGVAAASFTMFVLTFPSLNCFLMRNQDIVEQPYVSENLTQRMTREAVEFLERCLFFLLNLILFQIYLHWFGDKIEAKPLSLSVCVSHDLSHYFMRLLHSCIWCICDT